MTKNEPTTAIDSDALGQMTIAELLEVHNGLAEQSGADALQSWKRAKPEPDRPHRSARCRSG